MNTSAGTVVRFVAAVSSIDSTTIVRLPPDASDRLPSRGQVAVRGTINGHDFATVLEPDGRKGHWLRIDDDLAHAAKLGEAVDIVIEVRPDWPEPDVPDDLRNALARAPREIRDRWDDITPMARWEWVRWVQATANPSTRQRRVDVTVSKLSDGKRRPCCFDLSACTDVALARSGKLRAAT